LRLLLDPMVIQSKCAAKLPGSRLFKANENYFCQNADLPLNPPRCREARGKTAGDPLLNGARQQEHCQTSGGIAATNFVRLFIVVADAAAYQNGASDI
jgi:hypothetical protein